MLGLLGVCSYYNYNCLPYPQAWKMPRKKKAFGRRLRTRCTSAPAVLSRPRNRPSKRKNWTNEQMVAAMNSVKNGSFVKAAAKAHGVTISTLRDRINGRVVHGTNPGPKPYLNVREEGELSTFLKTCSDIGYGKTRRDIMCIAQSVALDKDTLKRDKITEGWWRRFRQRQPDLSLRRGNTTAHVRMNAVNSETMKQYFSMLNDVMNKYDLYAKPAQIYSR